MAGGWTSTASTGGGRQLVVPVFLLLVLTLLMVMASAAGRGANVNKPASSLQKTARAFNGRRACASTTSSTSTIAILHDIIFLKPSMRD
ncbi:hypothetical protein DAI22_12g071900 [Oryza sativa Japonica Group]|nr:hypothetical protein DAI22_12g071900 [Oryza sativa Japonica Group]